ncbi:MAG: hypothetical protein Q9222_003867 [Ikaeria aurantiellina]
MSGKRKRHRPDKSDAVSRNRTKRDTEPAGQGPTTHPTLSLYYPRILTLRAYLLSKLPKSSKTRKRKITALSGNVASGCNAQEGLIPANDTNARLAKLLDCTLVCERPHEDVFKLHSKERDFQTFSQRFEGVDESSLLEGNTPQSEIVDFAIWLLFHRIHRNVHKPPHVLCHGYQRRSGSMLDEEQKVLSGIPGLVLHCPNGHVGTLKNRPWTDLLNLLGKNGEQIMLDMLLGCAIYLSVENGEGNYYQLSGKRMKLSEKMQLLHARCAYYELLKHYCPVRARSSVAKTISNPGPSKRVVTTTDRSQSSLMCSSNVMQTQLNNRCATTQNTDQPKSDPIHVPGQVTLVDYAQPFSQVSAFCRAVISNVVPHAFWGQAEANAHNKDVVFRQVDRFVRQRRFESFTLHEVYQDLKIASMTWLIPPRLPEDAHISSSDLSKRKEILFEFLYYLFDSLLIPLIRSNFHVTESNVHKNRIFYFRHDVWRALTEPAITTIKQSMFEEIPTSQVKQLLDARALGFSQIRLLPKGDSVRPIMNLRRRVTKLRNGKAVLGRSINSILAPVHKVLDYARQQNPAFVGSALFSVGDMYPKLKAFRERLCSAESRMPRLYFAKVDVKSCFDTIPQRSALKVIEELIGENAYRVARHAQIRVQDAHSTGTIPYQQGKPVRKFLATAHPPLDFRSFEEIIEEASSREKKHAVFVDNVLRTTHRKHSLLDMLKDHVLGNIIKIGKKFFRQKRGIPQGSVLSSLLCNCFYARLEAERFCSIMSDGAILLRLIDDFLFITTKQADAEQFLQIMHQGIEEFGVQVNPSKSLVNFSIDIHGSNITRTISDALFPYCGTLINTRTLEISKDRDRGKATALSNALTVEQSSSPGQAFHRKAMNAFKIQAHRMFLDTSFNSINNVMANIYQNFFEAAMKYYRYLKSMRPQKEPHSALLIETIRNLIDMAFALIKSKHRSQTPQEYRCAVSKRQVSWLALTAFHNVLKRKQTKFQGVLEWVEGAMVDVRPKDRKEAVRLTRAVERGRAAFGDVKY